MSCCRTSAGWQPSSHFHHFIHAMLLHFDPIHVISLQYNVPLHHILCTIFIQLRSAQLISCCFVLHFSTLRGWLGSVQCQQGVHYLLKSLVTLVAVIQLVMKRASSACSVTRSGHDTLQTLSSECRMEAVPSVPFHERAPDLMQEEDIKNNQLEAEESASRLQGSCWQPPRDMREGFPEERQQRADISHQLQPNGEGQPTASGAERQGGPTGIAAEKAQRGDTSHGLASPLQHIHEQCGHCSSIIPVLFPLGPTLAS